jgi:hypothetical protein
VIALVSDLLRVRPELLRLGVYGFLGGMVFASIWSKDLTEVVAWGLVLYLAWRLWKKDDPQREV